MTFVVTGATSGIGLATAIRLAQENGDVAVVARSEDAAARTAALIRADAATGTRVSCYAADLARLEAVHVLAQRISADHSRLQGMVLCAAVANPSRAVTDGIDTTLAVNHLAPVLLTRLLDDSLDAGRVVLVSSSQHGAAGAFDPAVFDPAGHASAMRRYKATKLLNLLFADARVGHPHRAALEAVDPGFVRTNLGRNARGPTRGLLTVTRPWQSSPDVAATLIVRRLRALDFEGGAYHGLHGLAKKAGNARDRDAAQRAWEWTNRLLE